MPGLSSFDYAVVRVVPRVEREEFVNAGLVLFCAEQKFLQCRIHLDEERLRALCPDADVDLVNNHLKAYADVCSGEENAGPIAQLPPRQRFHWLVAPRSTVIQVSPVHSGLCKFPAVDFERLYTQLVMSG